MLSIAGILAETEEHYERELKSLFVAYTASLVPGGKGQLTQYAHSVPPAILMVCTGRHTVCARCTLADYSYL